ncbi:dihydrofolate reductase family protein [Gordonia neofelifaecis]|uniref:Bifunctional deaminase-reductase domain-containing protein n=1 Tax=Gordonia neofelifaecis NRRL B-59395 TaxID=644548 RepID=F1YML5_9ACTN|nr:dihydrofolate reductase family protein [Gordonia neofelifaecis]EGD53950.1 bifunctional deaminase-reductase domain-containing protein [Gordonia neofelifaecis NRRL B-59395]
MFILQKATDVTADELERMYAFGASERPLIRANMVAGIDGAATADGKSGSLGSDGDRQLFHLQRALADVIVVGASTAVAEGYHPPTVDPRYAAGRAERGQSAVPLLVLVSRSLNLPVDYPTATHPDVLIATCSEAPDEARSALLDAGAGIVDCGRSTVDPHALVAELAARGHRRVLCEGGPRFLAELAAAGLLDELALTISPIVTGGDAPRIARGAVADAPMRVRHLLGDDEGYLFQLWERAVDRPTHTYD